MDPTKVKPRRDWCLILGEPRKPKMQSGIILPVNATTAERLANSVATILRVGVGKKNEVLGLKEGMRVCMRDYLKYVTYIPTDERWPETNDEKMYAVVSSDDIIGIVEDGAQVGVLSERKKP